MTALINKVKNGGMMWLRMQATTDNMSKEHLMPGEAGMTYSEAPHDGKLCDITTDRL